MSRPHTIVRELANGYLQETLAGIFALPVTLTDPDGVEQIYNALDAALPVEERRELAGQVMFARKRFDPNTGGDIIVPKPVVSLPKDSLVRVPKDDDPDHWLCKAPTEPKWDAPKTTYRVGRPIEGGDGHSMIRLYLEVIDDIERDPGGLL
jgi:hypothetical protein